MLRGVFEAGRYDFRVVQFGFEVVLEDLDVVPALRDLDGKLACARDHRVGAHLDERLHDFKVAVLAREVEQGLALLVFAVDDVVRVLRPARSAIYCTC